MRILTAVLVTLSMFLVAATAPTGHASAEDSYKRRGCSVRSIAGHWLFATDVGRIIIDPENPSSITALGTMHIDRRGNISGTFDATVSYPAPPPLPESGFLPAQTYTGTIVVNRNCTGTLEFVTSQGNTRTDSIAIVSPHEMWGMSQVSTELWTYRARKVAGRRR